MYFALEVLHQQILSQHPSHLVLSALLEQPFPEFHKAHGNQDLISYLPGKIPIMSSHWCKKSDIKTGSVAISIPAPGDCDVLLERKAKISFSLKPVSSQHSSSLLRMFGLIVYV